MLHTIMTIIVNLIVGIAVLSIWISIVCAVFKVENKYLPFKWFKLLIPVIKKVGKAIAYLSKVLFKWIIFTLEQLWYFLVEITKKLFNLLYDPNV